MSWFVVSTILFWYLIWKTFYVCLVCKNDQKMAMITNVWKDFTYSGICTVYEKTGIWSSIDNFIIPLVCVIPESTRNDYFLLIWLVYGMMVHVYTFFVAFWSVVNMLSTCWPQFLLKRGYEMIKERKETMQMMHQQGGCNPPYSNQ